MRIAIEAVSIGSGGGLSHLRNFLHQCSIMNERYEYIDVYTTEEVWKKISPQVAHINLVNCDRLVGKFSKPFYFIFLFPFFCQKISYDLIFLPACISSPFLKGMTVSMPQNMLLFDKKERDLFGMFSAVWLKFVILSFLHKYTLKNSNGIVFLSDFARKSINDSFYISKNIQQTVIHHGIEDCFFDNEMFCNNSIIDKYRFLYISPISPYKHQIEVVEAFISLRKKLPANVQIELTFVGPVGSNQYSRKLWRQVNEVNDETISINIIPGVDHSGVKELMCSHNVNIYASSCENLPIGLLEIMCSGNPILCSNYGPMPEVLGSGAIYFDPYDINSIEAAIMELIESPVVGNNIANNSCVRAKSYTWQSSTLSTLNFFRKCLNSYSKKDVS